MATTEIDFEGVQQPIPEGNADDNSNVTNGVESDPTDLTEVDSDSTDNIETPEPQSPTDNNVETISPGTIITVDNEDCVIDNDGNLLDSEGNIKVPANNLEEWLNSQDVEDDDDNPSLIGSLIENTGITLVDEQGRDIDFPDTPEGITDYVNAAINVATREVAEGTINKFFAENPVIKEFYDHVRATGSSRGFQELPDRSFIHIDKDNVSQQKAIIQLAAEEFGNKMFNENYINYLESTGDLYNVAKEQLANLVELDKQRKANLEARAIEEDNIREANKQSYYQHVYEKINGRRIGQYLLPESMIVTRNNKKMSVTLDDFFDYVCNESETDNEGRSITKWGLDLNNRSIDEITDQNLLYAWCMFTGTSYSDLINMAINEEKVKRLRVRANKAKTRSKIKATPRKQGDRSNIMFE